MQLKSEWRKFAQASPVSATGVTYWFHARIPAQSEFVATFLKRSNVDTTDMNQFEHCFYLLHGFLIDCEYPKDHPLAIYFEDMVSLSIEAAYALHIAHPLLDTALYQEIHLAWQQTRDKSFEETALDVASDEDEEKVEKKDKTQ